MKELAEYLPIIVIIAFTLVIVLLAVNTYLQSKFFKNIVSSKFDMNDIEEVDIETGKRAFALIVSNRAMNDAAVTAVGINSGLEFYDFKERYKQQKDLNSDIVVILPRSPMKLILDIEEVERLLFANAKNGKLQKVKVYAIDGTGNVFVHSAPSFHKVIARDFKALKKHLKIEKKEEFIAQTDEMVERGEKCSLSRKMKTSSARKAVNKYRNAIKEAEIQVGKSARVLGEIRAEREAVNAEITAIAAAAALAETSAEQTELAAAAAALADTSAEQTELAAATAAFAETSAEQTELAAAAAALAETSAEQTELAEDAAALAETSAEQTELTAEKVEATATEQPTAIEDDTDTDGQKQI